MAILVLGSTGFAGTNICNILRENSLEFEGVSRSNGVDLRQTETTVMLLEKIKPAFIINAAAHVGSLNYVTEKAADVIIDNSKMVMAMYEAAARVCPETIIINPIANCAYPGNLDVYEEDKWQLGGVHRSVLSYGSARRFMWAVGECFAMQYGIKTISLLTPNMYGTYDSPDPNKAHALNALVSKFVKAEMTGQKEIEVWGTGFAIREWLYAKDFARIILYIIKNPHIQKLLTEPVNMGQNFGLNVRELINLIQKNFAYSGSVYYNTEKPDGAPKKVMDNKRFREYFPNFEFTDFDNGIKETIQYYKEIYPY
jgi:GDP-L-fucose synthase